LISPQGLLDNAVPVVCAAAHLILFLGDAEQKDLVYAGAMVGLYVFHEVVEIETLLMPGIELMGSRWSFPSTTKWGMISLRRSTTFRRLGLW